MLATDERFTIRLRPSRRARRLGLSVRPGGEVVVTVPSGTSSWLIDGFLRSHAAWLARAVVRMSRLRGHVFLPRDRRAYLRHKEEARRLVMECLARHAPRCGVGFGRVSIKNMRRNWGSCSEKGNLNFNYKLALLPPHLAEYVVVHELCHRAHFDHSSRFWTLVGRVLPDHRERRAELRKYHA